MGSQKILDERVEGKRFELPRHPRVAPMTVKNMLKQRPSIAGCLSAHATSQEALKLMAERNLGAVLVLDAGCLVGIFSESDYARGSTRAAQSVLATPLRELMTPCTVSASLTDSVQDCLSLMAENRMRYLPVQDKGELIATLLLEDLLKEMVVYLERVFRENELDQQIVSLRGTYSC